VTATVRQMTDLARRTPLATLAGALAVLDGRPLDEAERLTRAVLCDAICERSPAADAAFDAWADDETSPPDGGIAAILAAVTTTPGETR
jgi:hypothetical protein